MAILTAERWQAVRGTTVTGADLTSAAEICAAVSSAIANAIKPFSAEPVTITDFVMDAPPGNVLELPVKPARSVTSIYLRWGANGDPSAFTADDLLTQYDGYYMPVTDPVNNWSRTGLVYRRGSSTWGYEYRRPVTRLGYTVDPNRGAVKVTYAAGPTSVPDDLFGVACQAATLLFNRRVDGAPLTSESWNGRSVGYAAPFLTSFLTSPDVADVILRYATVRIG